MPKFVIGIGSQRAGSTLLHKVLDECTGIFMHPVKELHYYDTLYGVRHPDILKEYSQRQIDRELNRLISATNYGYMDKRYKCYIRTNKILANKKIEDVDYLDLYRPCIAENEMLGEITPEYMILPEDGVKKMAEDLGRDTKIILIKRDPVDRFISAYKLLKMYRGGKYDKEKVSEGILEVLETMPEWVAQQAKLNDYDSAIENYNRNFDDVLLLHYESIVGSPQGVASILEGFLDTPVDHASLSSLIKTRVNSIGDTGEVSDEVKGLVKERLGV